ncbi:unnamed protein product, partial [Phaeothamnion confervicola]
MAYFHQRIVETACQAWFALCILVCMSTCWLFCNVSHLWGSEADRRRRSSAVCHACFRWLLLKPCPWVRIRGPTPQQWEALLDHPKVLLVMNHTSFIDSIVFVASCPPAVLKRYRTLMKASLFRLPLLGGISRCVGHFPVYFVTEQKDEFRVDKAAQAEVSGRVRPFLAGGGSLSLFPEGRTNGDPAALLPLRRGAFALAAEYGMDVVSLVSWGNHVAWPLSRAVGGLPADIALSLAPVATAAEGLDAAALMERTAAVMQMDIDRL